MSVSRRAMKCSAFAVLIVTIAMSSRADNPATDMPDAGMKFFGGRIP